MPYLKLDNPCSENWDNMTPNEKGRFCDKCAKTVFDFSKMDIFEISEIIRSKENVCGKFRKSQLKQPLLVVEDENEKSRQFPKLAAGFLLATSLLTNEANAQNEIKNQIVNVDRSLSSDSFEYCYLQEPIIKEKRPNESFINFNGNVQLKDSLVPLKNVEVNLYSLKKKLTTYTDSFGNFSFKVPDLLADEFKILHLSFSEITNEIDFYFEFGLNDSFLVINRKNLIEGMKIQSQISELINELGEIIVGEVDIDNNTFVPDPLVYVDGVIIKYKDYRNGKTHALKDSKKMDINFIDSRVAKPILGRRAPGGFYLIYSKE